jgi:ribosomal protein S18 acetylase RimI-like enzyme
MALIVALSISLTTLYHQSLSSKSFISSTLSPNASSSQEITMVHHYPDKPGVVHVPDTPLDACRILEGCFPDGDSIYHDHAACISNMVYVLKQYPSSALINSGKVVGFISFYMEEDPDKRGNKAMLIYNVCVDPNLRGQGLAKRMLKEGGDALIEHQKIDKKSLLLGLDVDLTSKMAAESFSLYAKLGYLRGWQPCRSVGSVDWRPLFNTPTSPAIRSPLPELLVAPKQYQENELYGKKPGPRLRGRSRGDNNPDHYCMFKFYEESWITLGNIIAEPFRGSGPQSMSDPIQDSAKVTTS